ncbi:MAG TPA: 16S rRNA (cytosine(1402)-N(4))-methyltransferase RsmH [Vitreimonas sp.]|nr:16S rRNA (cytosine(1402)-N(4))-methyltransferase RsmH [Vitreimonas sp.]
MHKPVLLTEALAALQVKPDQWYIDGTFGRGGHTRVILDQGGRVIAFDWDAEAITYGQETFAAEIADQKLILIRESFEKLQNEISKIQATDWLTNLKIAGILFDFGTSTDQLTSSERGFSFAGEGELDMRMDDRLGVKAKDLLMVLPERQLAQLFSEYGGEREARKIARVIVEKRSRGQAAELSTTHGFAQLIAKTKHERSFHLHPATKVFQALRIAVNGELQAIATALPQAFELLEPGGRIVTIAFHEGEDRLVKTQFQKWDQAGQGELMTKHPLTASEEELTTNNKARSAKLRIIQKC